MHARAHSCQRGITLIELLVVVSIMMLLALVAVPMMRPAMENRQVRETARAINVFLSSVRNRAIESGRPCGVLIQRMRLVNPNDTSKTLQFTQHSQSGVALQQIEIPPPYTGNVAGATVRVQNWTYRPNGSPYWPTGAVVLKLKIHQYSFPLAETFRRGDLIQLGNQGPWFTIVEDPYDQQGDPIGCGRDFDFPLDGQGFIDFSVGQDLSDPKDGWIDDRLLTVTLDPRLARLSPWTPSNPLDPDLREPLAVWPMATSFTILRQPYVATGGSTIGSIIAMRSAVRPLELPRGLVVDLESSGPESDSSLTQWFAAKDTDTTTPGIQDPSAVIIVFAPTGAIQSVMCSRMGQVRVTEPICLLLGKRDRMDPTNLPEDGLKNWQDLNNLWIAISPQNGLVTVAPVFAEPGHVNAAGLARPETIDESRRLVRQAQFNKGGR